MMSAPASDDDARSGRVVGGDHDQRLAPVPDLAAAYRGNGDLRVHADLLPVQRHMAAGGEQECNRAGVSLASLGRVGARLGGTYVNLANPARRAGSGSSSWAAPRMEARASAGRSCGWVGPVAGGSVVVVSMPCVDDPTRVRVDPREAPDVGALDPLVHEPAPDHGRERAPGDRAAVDVGHEAWGQRAVRVAGSGRSPSTPRRSSRWARSRRTRRRCSCRWCRSCRRPARRAWR